MKISKLVSGEIKLPGGKKFKIKWDQHVPIIAVISLILIVGTAFSYNKIGTLQRIVRQLVQEKDENLKELEKYPCISKAPFSIIQHTGCPYSGRFFIH